MVRLEAERLSLGYDGEVVVHKLNHAIPQGQITALVGPNGSGKSTVLRGLARILAPLEGAALIDGKAIHLEPTRQIARLIAILPQTPRAPSGLTVSDLVRFGRYPHRRPFRGLSAEDQAAVQRALELVELSELADRPVSQLSGGQAQRVWIAMTLAQETEILLLDEPTTYLDISHQLEVLDLLHALNRDQGLTVVMAMHDLNLAARYSDQMVALREGRIIAQGPPAEFISEEILERVFDVAVDIVRSPSSSIPVFVPRSSGGRHA